MKYIKTYEDSFDDNPRLPDLLKLITYLKKVFQGFGYTLDDWYRNIDMYELYFNFKKGRAFDIIGDYSTTLIFLKVVMRIASTDDILAKFIPEYFKTIDGLKLYREDKDFFTTTFQIVGDVDDIISQITKEDIETKIESIKYNL